MATNPYTLKNSYVTGSPPSAADLNRRANILRAQLPGALSGVGEGVLPLPDENALKVIYDSGIFYALEGAAYVRHENGHLIFVENNADYQLENVTPGSENFVFIVAYLSSDPGVHDSETARLCKIVVSDTDSYPGGLLLGEIAPDGTLTDRRTFIPVFDLLQRVEQLEGDVDAIEGRLDALESGDSGDGGPSYIAPAKWSSADPRETQTVIEEMIEAQLNSGGAAAPAMPMQLPEDRLAEAILHTRDGVIRLSPSVADAIEAAELVVGFSGHAQDGSPPPAPAINDTENVLLHSTLQIDTGNRELTP